eukprot:TRINITY_DN91739_c0_g1_i1.p1 TRINITY_DN91739_c0_g1~~TRINITY_DN91739_c0_g1_i1.p1  ORF type:complete len:518 (+),score=88.13 TRINITY_DN91739_c0_g1_i1:119-1555(+)
MIGAIMFGIDCGNFGEVQGMPGFLEEWCIGRYGDQDSCAAHVKQGAASNNNWLNAFVSIAAALLHVGAAIGSGIPGPVLTKKLGRRACICIGACVCFLGCLLTSYLTFQSVPVFFLGRLLTGGGIGITCFALPIYNSEVSAPSMRGTTGFLFQVNVVVGMNLAAILTYFIQDWQVGMILPGAAAVVVGVAVWLTPESPRYVMAKHGFEAGAVTLAKVREGDVTAEAMEVHEQILSESQAGQVSYLEIISNSCLRKRVFISCWLQIGQQFTGYNTIMMFAGTMWVKMGFNDPFAPNMAFQALQLITIVMGLWLIDSRFGGRRPQLLLVTVCLVPLIFLTGLASALSWPPSLMLVFVVAFGAVWQLAWGPLPWVYPSEIFSISERDRATSIAVFFQYGANAVLMFTVPVMMSRFGLAGMFWFHAAFNLLNLAFVVLFIRETKGVLLEEVPSLFGDTARGGKSMKIAEGAEVDEGSSEQTV